MFLFSLLGNLVADPVENRENLLILDLVLCFCFSWVID